MGNVATSADSDPEIQLAAFKRGSCLHLVKPITLDDMGVVWQKAWGIEANTPIELQRVRNTMNFS